MLRQVSAMPTNRFHGLGLWPSIPVLLARVPHQTADCFYRPGTALRGMTAGKGGEELYKQKQALNVSYALDPYHIMQSADKQKDSGSLAVQTLNLTHSLGDRHSIYPFHCVSRRRAALLTTRLVQLTHIDSTAPSAKIRVHETRIALRARSSCHFGDRARFV